MHSQVSTLYFFPFSSLKSRSCYECMRTLSLQIRQRRWRHQTLSHMPSQRWRSTLTVCLTVANGEDSGDDRNREVNGVWLMTALKMYIGEAHPAELSLIIIKNY